MEQVRIIGIAGGSGSGKTTIVNKISQIVSDFVFLPQDNYYRSAAARVDNENMTAFNFDHPDAFDHELLRAHLEALKRFEPIDMPQYDFVLHRRREQPVGVQPRRLVIFEGIMVFVDPGIRRLIDLKLFVDTPDDIRFSRRLRRDIEERGRTLDSVVRQYIELVRPGHHGFVKPTRACVDLIIPEGGYNESALQVLISFMKGIVSQ